MAGYLVDTNHLSHAIQQVSVLRDRLRQECHQGQRFGVCWPVLCELEAGICHLKKAATYRRTLQTLVKDVRIWPTDWDTVRLYGELSKTAKKKGRLLSHVDLVLAALAQQLKVTL